jgi:hypothetical protein
MDNIYILGYVFVFALMVGLVYFIIQILISFIKNLRSTNKHNWFHLHHEH